MIKFNTQPAGKINGFFGHPEAHGKHHNVERFFHPPSGIVNIAYHLSAGISNRDNVGDFRFNETNT